MLKFAEVGHGIFSGPESMSAVPFVTLTFAEVVLGFVATFVAADALDAILHNFEVAGYVRVSVAKSQALACVLLVFVNGAAVFVDGHCSDGEQEGSSEFVKHLNL